MGADDSKRDEPIASLTDQVAHWFELLPLPKPAKKGVKEAAPPTAEEVAAARVRGDELLAADVEAFERYKKKTADGDDRYMQQVLKAGTIADKVAAMTLLVQESPVHRLSTLDALLALAAKKERRTSRMALDAVKDLFLNNLLPSARRLRTLDQQPLGEPAPGKAGKAAGGGATKLQLLLWRFEEIMREKYAAVVEAVQDGLRDNAVDYRRFCLDAAFELLGGKP